MSNADYTIRAVGTFCPVAELSAAVTPLATNIPVKNVKTTAPGDRFLGMAALIDDEIVRVVAINAGSVDVVRGCADTVPAAHTINTVIWFFENDASTDSREYLGTETVSLKLLPRTASQSTPMAYAPPFQLTFAQRFNRPYPPGQMQANGTAWFTPPRITASVDMTLAWVGRNRLIQLDQLVGHIEAGVTPEDGTTYRVRLFTEGGSLVRTITGLTGTSWVYDRATAAVDFGLVALTGTGDYDAYLLFDAMREGLGSWQSYRVDFAVDTTGL